MLQAVSQLPLPGFDQAISIARQVSSSTKSLVEGTDGAVHIDVHQGWSSGPGGTAAHEGGHNYGLSHGDGAIVRPGEDALTNHIMPAGSLVFEPGGNKHTANCKAGGPDCMVYVHYLGAYDATAM